MIPIVDDGIKYCSNCDDTISDSASICRNCLQVIDSDGYYQIQEQEDGTDEG